MDWLGLDLSQNITPPRAPCGANNYPLRDAKKTQQVNMMSNELELQTNCVEVSLKNGQLAGRFPSPLPFLPPLLAKNAQMVLVESHG